MSAVVVAPGFLTTVQDLGRPGWASIGVSASGAADPIALRVANRLVGNSPGAAALEMTLLGPTLRFERDAIVAVTGADAAGIEGWRARRVASGETLACGPLANGARAYLAVGGGIAIDRVLGSASTHLATALGGLGGRAVAAGDHLALGAPAGEPRAGKLDPRDLPGYRRGDPFRATDGPQAAWFTEEARMHLYAKPYVVSEACDRMGIRLDGAPLVQAASRELITEGVVLGAIQVPAGGQPIVLFVEHQTSGGYPKIATVAGVDASRLGQLRPRDTLRFAPVSFDEAVALLRKQAHALDELLA
ncbi:MAG TPA: biotin-dependent carboxyltransferase family protein [Candidatus Polarisedimenticolaceae bacterium]|nr:biotin-dependent carboxyltransferase family protein [Candidatus Polarisedimenticolaceae bacterium]